MKVNNPPQTGFQVDAEAERRRQFASHIRRQTLFQRDVRWQKASVDPQGCGIWLVPNEITCELEPLTCAID